MKDWLAQLYANRLKKTISSPPLWIVSGIVLTLISSLFCTCWSSFETDEYGGGTTKYGYPCQPFIRTSKCYWISHGGTVNWYFHPIQFMLNLLFYTGSSYLVTKTAILIDKNIPLNKIQKAGIVLVSPYVFLNVIRVITRPFMYANYRQTLGLRVHSVIQEVYSWYNDYLGPNADSKIVLTQLLYLGGFIYLVGFIKASRDARMARIDV
jgi:hypothetical protein